jgi:hypothetical protein
MKKLSVKKGVISIVSLFVLLSQTSLHARANSNDNDLIAADLSLGSIVEFKTMNSSFLAVLNQLSIGSIVVARGYDTDDAHASCYFSSPTPSQVDQTVVGDLIFNVTSISQGDNYGPIVFSGNATLDGTQKGSLKMVCENDLGLVTIAQLRELISQGGGTLTINSKPY